MNPLALAWAERELKRLESLELRQLAKELNRQQADLAQLRELAWARQKANMRQDGPNGFVMVMT
ncbi:MAG: hypothetical protein ACK5PF_01460 [bacterium]